MGAASSIGRAGPAAAAGCVPRPSPQAASCCSCPGRPQLAPGQLLQVRQLPPSTAGRTTM